jgi:sensor histidine kinase YesM
MRLGLGNEKFQKLFGSKIRIRMTLVLLLLVIIPLLIIIVATNTLFGSYIQSSAMNQLEYSNLKIGERFKQFNRELNDITTRIIINETVQKTLGNSISSSDSINLSRYLPQYGSNYIDSILYMDNKNNIYSTSWYGNKKAEDVFQSAVAKKLDNTYAKLVWSWQIDDLFSDDGQKHLFVARYIRHLDIDFPPGILILKINNVAFEDIVGREGLMVNSNYFLLDQTATIVYNRNTWKGANPDFQLDGMLREDIAEKRDVGISRYQDKNRIILYAAEIDTMWKIVSIIPFDAIMTELGELQGIMYSIVAIAFIGTVIVAFLYTKRFTRPIYSIVKSLRAFQKGEFTTRLALKSHDEFEEIGKSFNQMATDIDGLMKTIQEDHETIRIAELNSLIYQINPHFIYNTLDNIHMLSRLSGDKKTGELIRALSRLLRISLSKGHGIIGMEDEIEHARSYLFIQKIRYGDLFEYDIVNSPDMSGYKVIKFILQPLIENCITHGFSRMDSGGKILIRVCDSGESVLMIVLDNGSGIDDEKLVMLNRLISGDSVESGIDSALSAGGYAVSNVAARLRLSYGSGATLKYENAVGGGTCCTVTILKKMMSSEYV